MNAKLTLYSDVHIRAVDGLGWWLDRVWLNSGTCLDIEPQ